MMKKSILTLLSICIVTISFAQKGRIRGIVRDATIGETLIGANVLISKGIGTITDFDGKFTLEADYGEYNIQVSYVGYEPYVKKITVSSKSIVLNVKLEEVSLNEILVVADVARSRETPVAFTNILPAQLEEELGTQDLPMILNSTPGVYATQQGGGDGDARITIRGFNQRNIAVMLDGIPVNDMENGWVYWSNWFGLDAVTRSIQVQRGLGASKLALPSVGGTMNIITKGISSKREGSFKQEITSEGKIRSSFGYSTGQLKNGWGITAAGSYKNGKGWVDETWSKGYFYYLKVDKRIGKHIISASVYGAPQEHGQRAYPRAIATFDSAYAVELGVNLDSASPLVLNKGRRYNNQWGYLNRYDIVKTDSIFHSDTVWFGGVPYITQDWEYFYDSLPGEREKLHYKVNKYHKPLFSLKDFWEVNEKLYVSNIAYLSIGRGGGTATRPSLKEGDIDSSGNINWQKYYDNQVDYEHVGTIDGAIDYYSRKAGLYRTMSTNNHIWYGVLSTLNYAQSSALTYSGGIDLRSYKGTHYMELIDLMGGDYAVNAADRLSDSTVVRVGDKVYYHDDAWVRWGGLFAQVEYKAGNYSSFFNISGAYSGHKKIDYFQKLDSDTRETDWLWKPSFTIKGGFNYNFTERQNAFINLGYLSKTRDSKYIYNGYDAQFRDKTDNEIVRAIEFGYTFTLPVFSINVNTYYTQWNNRPMDNLDIEDGYGIVPGIDALHKGIETDFVYKILPNLQIQGLMSLGDWRWTKKVEDVRVYDDNDVFVKYITFDPTGVHIGDAAQTQYGLSLRYEPIKRLYINTKLLYFDRYYAALEPSSLTGEGKSIDENGNPRDSWRIPEYSLLDLHTGYTFFVSDYRLSLKFSMFNVLDKLYISDARNNDQYIYGSSPNDFGPTAASVFIGMGRRFSTSLKFIF